MAQEALDRGESVIRWWIGGTLMVVPLSGEAVKPIVESTTELKKGYAYDFFHAWLGNGLLTRFGDEPGFSSGMAYFSNNNDVWRFKRKLLTPTFHFNMLEGYMEVMDRHSRALADHVEKYVDVGSTVDLYPWIKCCALDIICDAAMGVQLNALDDPNQPYVRAVEEFNVLAQYIAKNPFYRLLPPLWYAMGYGFRTRRALKVLKDTSMK
ncbi:CRE-CYP-29A3 protein, partial [Aphelenchoides avenae]